MIMSIRVLTLRFLNVMVYNRNTIVSPVSIIYMYYIGLFSFSYRTSSGILLADVFVLSVLCIISLPLLLLPTLDEEWYDYYFRCHGSVGGVLKGFSAFTSIAFVSGFL